MTNEMILKAVTKTKLNYIRYRSPFYTVLGAVTTAFAMMEATPLDLYYWITERSANELWWLWVSICPTVLGWLTNRDDYLHKMDKDIIDLTEVVSDSAKS